MRYWWVNQNQTFRQERAGGYLWSPKRNADGGRNPFYEFMREVAPGDLVLSFEDTFIRAIGVVQSYCYECPKPAEFIRRILEHLGQWAPPATEGSPPPGPTASWPRHANLPLTYHSVPDIA